LTTADQPEPHPFRWWILATVLIGSLVGTLGNSMANVALPTIMDHFAIEISSATWVITIYILLVAVLMPIFGHLGDMYGYKRIYLTGLSLLVLSSALAALSPSFPLLVLFRALQGIGNATTLPSVMAIITNVFPIRERGRAMGLWATINGAGHGLGPVLSGFLTQYFGWPAIFLLNGAITLVGVLLIWRLVPPDSKRATHHFDFPGAVTMTLATLILMFNLTQGAKLGWGSTFELALWVVFAGSLAAFLLIENRASSPFVDLRLFTNRPYAAATAIIAAQFFCLFGMQLLLPLFLMRVQGYTSGQAGLLIFPLATTAALVAPLAGRFADSCGSKLSCFLGMGVVALAGVGLTFWRETTSPWQIVVSLVVLGLGMGLTQSPVAAAVTFVVAKERLGVALGIFNMFRFISGTLGTTIFGIILQSASFTSNLEPFRLDFYLLIAVASIAALLALNLPGPIACQSPSDRNE
jgi:EmrB/QacA subfamily drug resistance transporter